MISRLPKEKEAKRLTDRVVVVCSILESEDVASILEAGVNIQYGKRLKLECECYIRIAGCAVCLVKMF